MHLRAEGGPSAHRLCTLSMWCDLRPFSPPRRGRSVSVPPVILPKRCGLCMGALGEGSPLARRLHTLEKECSIRQRTLRKKHKPSEHRPPKQAPISPSLRPREVGGSSAHRQHTFNKKVVSVRAPSKEAQSIQAPSAETGALSLPVRPREEGGPSVHHQSPLDERYGPRLCTLEAGAFRPSIVRRNRRAIYACGPPIKRQFINAPSARPQHETKSPSAQPPEEGGRPVHPLYTLDTRSGPRPYTLAKRRVFTHIGSQTEMR